MEKTHNKRRLKKALKIVGLGCAGLLVVVIGLVIWLRTSSGAGFVEGQMKSALARQGITLTTSQFSGPLPGHLLARDVAVADADGPIFKAALVEVDLAPLAVLRGLLHIPLVKVVDPEVIRIPATGEDKPKEPSGKFSLPIEIQLDELSVAGGRLHEGALAALGIDTPMLTLAAGGSAWVTEAQSNLDFKAAIADGQGQEILNALIKLTGGSGSQLDQLDLALTVNDQPGGLLSRLMADPEWSGLNLSLTGQGALTDWNGKLALTANNLAQINADLSFAGQSGHWWTDLLGRPHWRAALEADITPDDGLPPEVLGWLGRQVAINLAGGLNDSDLTADLSVQAAREPALILTTNLSGALAEVGGDFKLAAQIAGLLPPEAPAGETQTDPALHLAANVALGSETRRVKDLTVSGAGFDLKADLRQQVTSPGVQGQLTLALADNSPWVAAWLELAGLAPDYFGGALNLTGDIDWRGFQEPVSGRLTAQGHNLRWPTGALSNLLGSSLTIEADLSGGGRQPIVADIKKADAGGASLSGQASFLQVEPLASSQFKADLKAALTDLAALEPTLGGPLSLTIKGDGQLDDLQVDLSLDSPKFITPQGAFTATALSLSAVGALMTAAEAPADSRMDLSGRLALTVGESPGGPLNLSTDWSVQRSGLHSQAALTNLSGHLAGLDLNGALTAILGADQPALTGALKAEVANWDKLAALTGQALAGSPAKLALTFDTPEKRQAVKADLSLPALKIGRGADQVLVLNQTDLTLLAADLFGQLDLDLDLKLGSGLSGPFSWGAGAIQATGRDGSGDFEVTLDRAKLAESGGAAQDGLKLDGHFDLATSAIDLNKLDFRLAGSGLKLAEPLRLILGESFKISPLSLTFLPKGQMTAEVDLTPGSMKIKADIKALPYSLLRSFGVGGPDGTLQSFTADLAQGPAGLAGDLNLKTQVAAKELKNIKPGLELTGKLSAGPAPALTLAGTIDGGPGWKSNGKIEARVPLLPSADGGFPGVNMNGALSGNIVFTGAVGPVWALLGQPDRSLNGLAEIRAVIGGTLAKPQPQGTVYLAGGRYEDSVVGLLINDITLEAHSTPEVALNAVLSAKDQYGGGLALEAKMADFNKPVLSAKGRLSRFSPLHRDDLTIFISGDLAAEGPLDKLSLTSDLTVDRGELDLKIAMAASSVPTLSISDGRERIASQQSGQRFGLKINVPNQFFIRGYGLESEWRGTLHVGGSTRRPSLVGFLAPVRGYFEIFSKEFQLSGGDISFNGGTNPNLNLELTNNGPNITALLKIGGNAKKPKLTFDSRPPLPQEEVLSQVLFGKSAASISRFEALQLANAIREVANFGNEGGLNALGFMRESLGLDVLRLGGTDNDRQRRASSLTGGMGQELYGGGGGGAGVNGSGGGESDDISVEAGKYISDKIYVGVEHSATGGSAVRMEVELKPNLSLEGRTSPESSRVGLGWKKDY